MRIAIIGRTKMLYDCIQKVIDAGHTVPLIITSRAAPEYDIREEHFEKVAGAVGAVFIFTPRINESQVIDAIRDIGDIDIAISINYTGVISAEVINLFPEGILNAHGGDLPKYRGNACQAWAIINAENEIGLCIHKMIGGELDSGDIIEKKLYPINIDTRVGEVYDWFQRDIPEMMISSIEKINSGNRDIFTVQSKNPGESLRCFPRLPEDGKINWNANADDVVRLVNASSEPYPGAFTNLNGEKLVVWRAELYQETEPYLAVAGQVCHIDRSSGTIKVSTGNGMVSISEIQLDDWRGLPADRIKSIRTRLI